MFVRKGNEQTKVLSLVIAIANLVGVYWVVEQPTSSVLPVTQPLEDVMAFSGGFKVTTWLGAFALRARSRYNCGATASDLRHWLALDRAVWQG